MPLVVQLYIHNARNIICAIALFLRACLQHRVLRVQLPSCLKMGTEKYASPGCDRPLGGAVQILSLIHIFCADGSPGNIFCVHFIKHLDLVAIDDDRVLLDLNGALETAVHGIVFQHVGHVVGRNKGVVDTDELHTLSLIHIYGSGKTTLMNMISGIYHPDGGTIYVDGKAASIQSPLDAQNLGIGMIHQHFKLVNIFSAMENIELGTPGRKLPTKVLREKVMELCRTYGLETDPEKPVHAMSVSEKQTVEILKVLYRGARILILDEPTAVLTPQETEKLFAILRQMRDVYKRQERWRPTARLRG